MRGRALLVALVGGALGQVPVCDSSSNHADIFCADGDAGAAVPSGSSYWGMCRMTDGPTTCPEGWDDQTDGPWSQCVKNLPTGSTVPACGACEVTSATIADLCCTDPEFEVAAGTAVGILGLLQHVDGSADCPSGWEFQDLGSLKQCIHHPVGSISAAACNCAADADCEQWDDDWDEDDEECDIETSGDRSSSPSGTTNHGAGNGWCYSDLDEHVGCAASPGDCWAMCLGYYGDGLVAIDWGDGGDCYCQHDCECMEDVGDVGTYLITRDSRVGALPHECGPDEGEGDEDEDEDEDWMWENGCRPDYCTSYADDCCAAPEDWGEPATCANGYSPVPANPTESTASATAGCASTTGTTASPCATGMWHTAPKIPSVAPARYLARA